MEAIYQYLLDWMKHHGSNRLPSNTDGIVFDLSSYNLLFTSFNLIVYLMFTAVLYSIFIGFVQLSLKYIKNILSEVVNRNGLVYITSAMEKMIVITKVLLVLVFVFTMTCSVFLYIYYHLPVDVAKHLNSTMITQYGKSMDYTIGYYTVGISFYYLQKFFTIVITSILGFYRTYALIKPLECSSYLKIAIVFLSVNFVSFVTQFITSMVAIEKTGLTFMELFNKCNNSIDLVFYSFVIAILSSVIHYILFYNKEKSVTNSALFLENKEYPRVAQIYDFYSGAQNILSIFFKLVTSTALFGVFQGSLFLFVAYIPGNTYDIYC